MKNLYEDLIKETKTERDALLKPFYERLTKAKNLLTDLQKTFKEAFESLGASFTLNITPTLVLAFNRGYDTCFISCNGYHRHYNVETLTTYETYGFYGQGIEKVLTEIESINLEDLETVINNNLLMVISNRKNDTYQIKAEFENNEQEESEEESEEETAE